MEFRRGNAVRLDFPDETFDVVTSNYVYHNIPGNRQDVLLETLRTLKRGGTFAIHDIFSSAKYDDMDAFLARLRDMGYIFTRTFVLICVILCPRYRERQEPARRSPMTHAGGRQAPSCYRTWLP